jgi:3-(3-hydroxy-phenyl)propionate hydroxylase
MNPVPILAAILVIAFSGLGAAKLVAAPTMRSRAQNAGFSVAAYRRIGALEIAAAVGLLLGAALPIIGALAATGLLLLLGGAVRVHLRKPGRRPRDGPGRHPRVAGPPVRRPPRGPAMSRTRSSGTDPFPVVIIGAGPVGVTAATLLGQYGVHCLVLDRWDGVYPQPRAVHLDDEVYRVLIRLGIGEQFAATSRPTRGLQLVDRNHRAFATFDRAGQTGRHGHPRANMFDQPGLERLMRLNLEDQPTVALRGNVEVTDIAQDGQGRMQVDFTDRLTGQTESVLATYVLGCDGANSVARAAISATMEDLKFEQRWLVIDVASAVELDQWDGVHQVCSPARAATYMRIGPDRYRWEFRLLDGETALDFRSIHTLRPLLEPWVTGIPTDSLELVRVAEYTFRAQIADHWRDRNVFLLGDAAHLTPPFIGQGLGAGIRDAMNLSWKIAAVLSGDLPESVLDTYEAERKPHARALINLATLIGVCMTQGGNIGDLLRKAIAPRLRWIPGLRDRLLDSQTPPLHRSALVEPRARRKSLHGQLCPNAPLADGTRYDDIARGGFVFVTRVPLTPTQRAALADRGTEVLEAEPGSPLHRWLADGHASAAVVRPDFTVMRADRNLAQLCDATPTFHTASPLGATRPRP